MYTHGNNEDDTYLSSKDLFFLKDNICLVADLLDHEEEKKALVQLGRIIEFLLSRLDHWGLLDDEEQKEKCEGCDC